MYLHIINSRQTTQSLKVYAFSVILEEGGITLADAKVR
jgi:hypothetical protein